VDSGVFLSLLQVPGYISLHPRSDRLITVSTLGKTTKLWVLKID
jgi:hypothetical protein